MQIEIFKVFCDLVETSSFSKAANLNAITQSAVSQQIHALEKKLKVSLIERGKKIFSVTLEGRAFLQASKEILRAYDSLSDRLQELQTTVAGELNIATVYSIGLHELPRYLKLFRNAYPAVEVTVEYLRSAQVYQRVAEGAAHIGLVAFPTRRKGVTVESYWRDKLVLICPPTHRLAKLRSVPIGALESERFISFAFDQPTRKAIDRIFKVNKVSIRRTMEFDNIETLKRAVEIEHGIAIVPSATVEEQCKIGSVVAVEIEAADMWRPIGLVQRRSRSQTAASRALIAILKRHGTL
jgi:LysR family transcriptional regulator, transcriptional activator of the cysJI operon